MEKNDRWDLWGRMPWFKFEGQDGAREFENISSLEKGSAGATVALRALKYQLENELGQEISDDLFCEIFRKVCGFRPIPGFGGMAILGLIQPLQRTLEAHGIDKKKLGAILRTFRANIDNPRYYKNIFLHIPHSSSSFPEESKHSSDDLDNEERLLIDYFTDELFVPERETSHISSVVFPYCRLYCDVERLVNDPLQDKGLGIHYIRMVRNRGYSFDFRSFSSREEAFSHYADFHASVSKKLLAIGDNTLLIDCHSFSSRPNLLVSNPPDVDICIGYNDDETCPDKVVIGNIVHHFKSRGYKVSINEPFSNSKTFSVPVKYHSVMIEVNKRLYMDEISLKKTSGFEKLQQDIQSLYEKLLKPSNY